MKRLRHGHPALVPPRWDKRLVKHGEYDFRWEKVRFHANDEGRVIDGRIYTYHPRKGWRAREYRS